MSELLEEQTRLQAIEQLEKSRRSLFEAERLAFGVPNLHQEHQNMGSLRERITEMIQRLEKGGEKP